MSARLLLLSRSLGFVFIIGILFCQFSWADTVDVAIIDGAFLPEHLTVESGTTIRWVNTDTEMRSFAIDGIWDSGELARGATYAYTFEDVGTYPFFSEYKLDLTGYVLVIHNHPISNMIAYGFIFLLFMIGITAILTMHQKIPDSWR